MPEDDEDPDGGRFCLDLVDAHAGGDVSRAVVGGVRELPGESLLEQLEYLRHEADGLRQMLLYEPYGDPAMSINLVVPAKAKEARAGFITMEAMGYPYFSGSNTLCTAAVLAEKEARTTGEQPEALCLETPDGLVHVDIEFRHGRVWSATCRGTPAYVVEAGINIELPVYGRVTFDLVFSGALYAVVRSEEAGIALTRENEPRLINFASELITHARPHTIHKHPEMGLLAPLPFVHFEGPEQVDEEGTVHSPTATYVHPGVVCRSPTGTGTSARMALKYHKQMFGIGSRLHTTSPRGSVFEGEIVAEQKVGDFRAIRCTTRSRVFILARSQVLVDFGDPLVKEAGLKTLLHLNQ